MELLTRSGAGDLEFDAESGVLVSGGEPVCLRPMATAALSLLTRRRGELVTREDLQRELWGETVVDYDASLNQVMRQVRFALRDQARKPRLLETVPRRGYRLRGERFSTSARRTRVRVQYFVAGAGAGITLPVIFVLVCAMLAGS